MYLSFTHCNSNGKPAAPPPNNSVFKNYHFRNKNVNSNFGATAIPSVKGKDRSERLRRLCPMFNTAGMATQGKIAGVSWNAYIMVGKHHYGGSNLSFSGGLNLFRKL